MRLFARLLLSVSVLLPIACSATEPAAVFKEGTQYAKVREALPPVDPKRVEVDEFFWYGCPHCYHLDPIVDAWRAHKPADVDFVRIPNSLGRDEGITHSKAFYTADVLNLGDKIHKPLFVAIHEQHMVLNTQAEMQAFFTAQTGILPDVFNNTFSGFAVATKVGRAESLSKSFGVASVPVIVVGGKYTTSPAMAGTPEQTFKVVDFLIAKVRQERKGK
jgi:thiol:disulfide interchange protein DsbA